jgi:hypothetical protein
VRANHSYRVAWLPCVTDGKGDDCAGVSGEIVFAAGLEGGVPGIAFLEREDGQHADVCGPSWEHLQVP